MVQRLSRLLDNPVHVRSVPGEGAVFIIEVPLGDESPAAPAPEGAADATGTVRFAVLLTLTAAFDAWASEVLAAGSAGQAVAKFREKGRTPDVIVTDYRLRTYFSRELAVSGLLDLCSSTGGGHDGEIGPGRWLAVAG